MLKLALVALPVIAALAPVSASAQSGAWKVGNDSYHLYYADLDMNSTAGRKAMLARVEHTAKKLCRELERGRACVADTVAQTVAKSGSPQVRLALAERNAVRLASR
jgi:UrcA family protein